jgi:hypothetical protein
MDTAALVRLLASRLTSMTPAQREAVIADLRDQTNFCWTCFRHVESDGICHCDNDE